MTLDNDVLVTKAITTIYIYFNVEFANPALQMLRMESYYIMVN